MFGIVCTALSFIFCFFLMDYGFSSSDVFCNVNEMLLFPNRTSPKSDNQHIKNLNSVGQHMQTNIALTAGFFPLK